MLSAPLLVLLVRDAPPERESTASVAQGIEGGHWALGSDVDGAGGEWMDGKSCGPICRPTSVSPLQAHCAGAAWRHPIRARAAGRRADWSGSLLECAAAYVLCTVLRTADVVRSNLNRRVRPPRPWNFPSWKPEGVQDSNEGTTLHVPVFLPSCPPALLPSCWAPGALYEAVDNPDLLCVTSTFNSEQSVRNPDHPGWLARHKFLT
jgi:hypothetical protein